MKRTTFVLCCFLSFCALYTTAVFAQITPKQDAYTNSADPTTNYGTAVTLGIANTSTSIQNTYLLFDLSSIPSGYTGANVAKATLKLYVNSVTAGGSFNVDFVNGTWTEKGITHNLAPALGSTIASSVPLTTSGVHDYVVIDVTTAVADWLNGTQADDGLALVANSPLNATIDSKENSTQSHPAELDVVFSGNGTIAGVLTGTGSGLTGGGNMGTLNLSLLKTCAANQVLQFVSGAWTCSNAGAGTVTRVATGTGLTGGPITGAGTISIANGGVGTAQIANGAVTNPLLASAAVQSGNLSAAGSSIGQVLTSNGSSVGWQAPPGVPDPLSLTQSSASPTITATNPSSGSLAILGISGSSSGIGNPGGSGVWGDSLTTSGVVGTAYNILNLTNVAGVKGTFLTGSGYQLFGGAAVWGDTNSGYGVVGTSSSIGVYGDSQGGNGVEGVSSTGKGILALSSSGYAAEGISNSSYGVYGISGCFSCSETNFGKDGVHGESSDSSSAGVAGQNFSGGVGTFGGVYNCPGGTLCLAGYFAGNVDVTGSLSKGGGSFKIDHPLDPANKYLYHSFVESPDMMNIYNGNVTTDANGEAVVQLPDWFEALNRDFRYQLTVIGQFAQAIVGSEIANGQFTIKTDKPNVKVSWQVTGIRQDAWANAHRIPVEEVKSEKERGFYLYPELFGAPAEQNIAFARNPYLKRMLEDTKKVPEEQSGAGGRVVRQQRPMLPTRPLPNR